MTVFLALQEEIPVMGTRTRVVTRSVSAEIAALSLQTSSTETVQHCLGPAEGGPGAARALPCALLYNQERPLILP